MNESTNIRPQYRQGDVFLIGNAIIPSNAIEIPRDPQRCCVLQNSQVTGNAHRVESNAAKMFAAGDARYLRVVEAVDLVHDEHTAIGLPIGDYQIIIHHEYEPGELPWQVAD